MRTPFLNSLLEAMPKPLIKKSYPVHHKDKSKGSPLDKYRCEIMALRHQCQCSYGEIALWLQHKKSMTISKKSIYKRIQYWNEAPHDVFKNKETTD